MAEFVDTLDREEWAELDVDINGEAMGAPAYHPSALLSVWLHGFMTNVRSCRKLEAACRDQLPCLWLTGWQRPDHNTLWRFYQKHRRSMRTLFRRTVRTAVTLELVDLAVQAVDGTKVHANAAHTRSLDAEQLNALLERTERAIAELEAQNEAGDDPAPARLPERLTDRETLRRRVRQALDELAVRKRNKSRVNLTDPDARALKARRGSITGYNAQAMVSPLAGGEENGMLVTAVDVVDSVNDEGSLTTMLERAEEETGVRTPLTLADAGYHAGQRLAASEQRKASGCQPLPQEPLHLRRGHRQLSLSQRRASLVRQARSQQGRAPAVLPARLRVGLHGLSRLRRLHDQRVDRTPATDQAARGRGAPPPSLDGD